MTNGTTSERKAPSQWDFPYPSQRALVFGKQAVATSHSLASGVAMRILDRGGNAVDAALAAAATLTVVEPTMNGIGGDLFAVVWDGQHVRGLNASGRSPSAWSLDRFAGRSTMPELGWDSVTVPGAVSGWIALAQRYATRPWTHLLSPAVAYAREGFPITPRVGALWAEAPARYAGFQEFERVFLRGGRAPDVGSWMFLPDAADTLEEIAATAGESFYRGALARRIATAARKEGGALSEHDLAAHHAVWVEPIGVDFAGIRLHELPPNGQGLATLLALSLLGELGLESEDPDDIDSIHLQVEAMKAAFAVCSRHLADPEAMRLSVDELLAPEAVRSLAREIRRDRASDARLIPPADHGTVYVAVGDSSGLMVSLIQSNYLGFGSGVVVPGTGISLHNRGLGFRLDPAHPSCVGGGKRPFHTLMPGFVTRAGAAEMAFGVIGGHMQPQAHVQLVVRNFLYGQNPQAACDAPRWHVTPSAELALEPSFAPHVARGLAERGHRLVNAPPTLLFGGAQAVSRRGPGYCAASDPRKDGQAVAL